MRLAGRRVLVTGAAGGIGAAITARLADEGAEVVASDLAIAPHGIACDIADAGAVAALVEQAGPLWGVVHAAAVCGGSGPFETVTAGEFRRYVEVNLVGAFHVLSAAAQAMVAARQGGRIVAIGSVNAVAAEPGAAPYAAAKGGLRMLVKAAAVDLARHDIAASLVHPGPIVVPRNAELFARPELREGFAARIPMAGPGEPAAVAEAVLYLLDPAARYTSGAEIAVDGGALAAFAAR